MLLLFWAARPVEVELDAAGTSDALLLSGLAVPATMTSAGSSAGTTASVITKALVAPLHAPLEASGEALTGLEYLLQIAPFYGEDVSGGGSTGDPDGNLDFRPWRRMEITIEATGMQVQGEALEP